MTTEERLAIVARVCDALWLRQRDITTDEVANRLCDDEQWLSDGYAGWQPYSRARRYARAYLQGLKKLDDVVVSTRGSDHYNAAGTAVSYRNCAHERRRYVSEAEQEWLDWRRNQATEEGPDGSAS